MLSVHHLTKTYISGNKPLTVLDDVSFSIAAGDTFAIVGPSGSGKTTLPGLCAGLDRATSGSVSLNGINLDNLNEDERAQVRNRYVGFIFQNFQLIPTLAALENVMVPIEIKGEKNARNIERWQGSGPAVNNPNNQSKSSGQGRQGLEPCRPCPPPNSFNDC